MAFHVFQNKQEHLSCFKIVTSKWNLRLLKPGKFTLIIRKPEDKHQDLLNRFVRNVDFAPGYEYFHFCDSLSLTLDLISPHYWHYSHHLYLVPQWVTVHSFLGLFHQSPKIFRYYWIEFPHDRLLTLRLKNIKTQNFSLAIFKIIHLKEILLLPSERRIKSIFQLESNSHIIPTTRPTQ